MAHGLDTDTRVDCYPPEFYPLHNFSAFRVHFDGIDYDTAEHAYQAAKFLGTDPLLFDVVRLSPSAHEAFKVAERWARVRRPDWDDIKLDVMRRIIRAKTEQHEYVRRKLLETGDREIIEGAWRDSYWGSGPDGQNQNWLGKLWMELRDELRKPAAGIEPARAAGEEVTGE